MKQQEIDAILKSTAYDLAGEKIGSVEEIFLDEETEEPTFIAVKTGASKTTVRLVPVTGYTWGDEGLVLAFDKDVVKKAPKAGATGDLEEAAQEELLSYYETYRVEDNAEPAEDETRGTNEEARIQLSEERVEVETESIEAGRVRMRKYTTTETENITVPVTREKVVIERVPVDAQAEAGSIDPDAAEEIEEIVLREERPVVTKETVVVEEISLAKETVTENVTVREQVAKEHVDIEGDDDLVK